MAKTKIEWSQEVWNPVRGCSKVSTGCKNCFAERTAARFSGPGLAYAGLTRCGRWTGEVRLIEHKLREPLRWRKSRMVFANSMSDLFHESLSDSEIGAIFAVMGAASDHTFQVLTKRARRMHEWFKWAGCNFGQNVYGSGWHAGIREPRTWKWPLPNVWLGVSVEDQYAYHLRVPFLADAPAATRFISCEPLLDEVRLSSHADALHWVIASCESGPGRRPASPNWFRALRDDCVAAGMAFFLKQAEVGNNLVKMPRLDGRVWDQYPGGK